MWYLDAFSFVPIVNCAHLSLQPTLYEMHFIVFILSLFSCNIDVKDETPTKFMGSAVTSIQGRLLKIQMCVKYVFYFSKVRDCLICSTLEIKDLKIYEHCNSYHILYNENF